MKTESTILEFPKHKIVRERIIDSEEVERFKEKNKKRFADSLVEDMSEDILYALSNLGLDTEGESFTKDFHFFVNTLYSLIYRSLDMPHDMHNFVDNHVDVIKVESLDEGESTIEIIHEDDET